MVHLRNILEQKRRVLSHIKDWEDWENNRKKYVSFTERYAYLVLFAHYLWTETQDGAGHFPRNPQGFQLHMQHLQKTISIYAMFEELAKLGGSSSADGRQNGRERDQRHYGNDDGTRWGHSGALEGTPGQDSRADMGKGKKASKGEEIRSR